MAGDHADVPFVQALKFGEGRPDGPPIWIVWHTTEEHELDSTAERVANYFRTLPDGRTVSSHYVHDNNSSVQCVRLADRAWTAGNRPGNNRGINIELAGFASQGAAGWADVYSQAMLRRACAIARRDMIEYKIPNRWCSIADLTARRGGHTTHNDLRIAFNVTTHTDPGPTFPRSLVLALVAGEETDMSLTDPQDNALGEAWATSVALRDGTPVPPAGNYPGGPAWVVEQLKSIGTAVSTLNAKVDALSVPVPAPVDTVALATALQPLLQTGVTAEQVEQIVDTELDEQSRSGADAD